jgi:hypothetical protein
MHLMTGQVPKRVGCACFWLLSLGACGADVGDETVQVRGWEAPEPVVEHGLTEHERAVRAELDASMAQPNAVTIGVPDGNVHREVVWLSSIGCSGVTLSERYIATAAHCVDGPLNFPSQLEGTLGMSVYYSQDGISSTRVFSGDTRVAIMPQFTFNLIAGGCSYYHYDVALIQLEEDASTYYRTRLQLMNFVMPDEQEIVGWGRHNNGSVSSGTYRALGIANVDAWGGDGYIRLSGFSHSDRGDSGGGFFVRPSSSSSIRVLTAIDSCAGGGESLGALIAFRRSWLHQKASDWGRPFTCYNTNLGSVMYEYSCTD